MCFSDRLYARKLFYFGEEPQNSHFILKWTKRRTRLIPPNEEQKCPGLMNFPDQNSTSYREVIITFIISVCSKAGYNELCMCIQWVFIHGVTFILFIMLGNVMNS